MTDSFKEEEKSKAGEDKKALKSEVIEKPVEETPSEEKTPKTPKSQPTKPKQKSTKKAATKSNSSEKKRAEEKKAPASVASTKSSNSGELEPIGKRSDPNYKTVGIMLPLKAHKRAKILLMDDPEERDFSDLMTELLEDWLAEQSL